MTSALLDVTRMLAGAALGKCSWRYSVQNIRPRAKGCVRTDHHVDSVFSRLDTGNDENVGSEDSDWEHDTRLRGQ